MRKEKLKTYVIVVLIILIGVLIAFRARDYYWVTGAAVIETGLPEGLLEDLPFEGLGEGIAIGEEVLTEIEEAEEEPEVIEEEEEVEEEKVEVFKTLTVEEGDLVKLKIKASDINKDVLTYTYGEPLDEDGKWQTKRGDAGDYVITLTVSDGELTTEKKILLVVEEAENTAPVLEKIEDIEVNEGDTIFIKTDATDKENDPLTFTYSGWMTSDTHETSYGDAGEYTVTVQVSDGELTDSQDVKIIVNKVNVAPEFEDVEKED